VNIGVMALRNTGASRQFLSNIIIKIKNDEWDQGLAACMLNRKTKYDCKHVQLDRNIKFDLFPTSIVSVEGIFTHADCRALLKRIRNVQDSNVPMFIKLVGMKVPRDKCIQLYDKGHVLTPETFEPYVIK